MKQKKLQFITRFKTKPYDFKSKNLRKKIDEWMRKVPERSYCVDFWFDQMLTTFAVNKSHNWVKMIKGK